MWELAHRRTFSGGGLECVLGQSCKIWLAQLKLKQQGVQPSHHAISTHSHDSNALCAQPGRRQAAEPAAHAGRQPPRLAPLTDELVGPWPVRGCAAHKSEPSEPRAVERIGRHVCKILVLQSQGGGPEIQREDGICSGKRQRQCTLAKAASRVQTAVHTLALISHWPFHCHHSAL